MRAYCEANLTGYKRPEGGRVPHRPAEDAGRQDPAPRVARRAEIAPAGSRPGGPVPSSGRCGVQRPHAMSRIAIVSAMHEELRALLPLLRRSAHRAPCRPRLPPADACTASRWCWCCRASARWPRRPRPRVLLERFGPSALLFTGVAGGLARRRAGRRRGDRRATAAARHGCLAAVPALRGAADRAFALRRRRGAERPPGRSRRHAWRRAECAARRALADSASPRRACTGPGHQRRPLRRHRRQSAALRAALPDALAVEMEGAAVAQVCADFGRPFAVLRTVSDRADDSAHVDFPRFVAEVAAECSRDIVRATLPHSEPACAQPAVSMPPRLFVEPPLAADASLALPEAAARHVQVLRLQPGNAVTLFDGSGGEWTARIAAMGGAASRVQALRAPVRSEREAAVAGHAGDWPCRPTSAWMRSSRRPPSSARWHRAADHRALGAAPDRRARARRQAHWQAIAVAACEQCGRNRVPVIHAGAATARRGSPRCRPALPARRGDCSAGAVPSRGPRPSLAGRGRHAAQRPGRRLRRGRGRHGATARLRQRVARRARAARRHGATGGVGGARVALSADEKHRPRPTCTQRGAARKHCSCERGSAARRARHHVEAEQPAFDRAVPHRHALALFQPHQRRQLHLRAQHPGRPAGVVSLPVGGELGEEGGRRAAAREVLPGAWRRWPLAATRWP